MTLRMGLGAAAAVLVLAGASLNANGRQTAALAVAAVSGILAVAAGICYRRWRYAVPLGALAVVLSLVIAQFNPHQGDLLLQLAGLVLLGVGGAVGAIAYHRFWQALQRQTHAVAALHQHLEQKHRAFLAATSDLDGADRPEDIAGITANIASHVGADLACCYLTSADGRRYVPQPPGVSIERLRPQAVNLPHENAGPLLSAIAGRLCYSR